jgi:hypothetical protein
MLIAHRINTVAELEKVPIEYGVEVDLRDSGNDLILAHDPFSTGELFENFLQRYRHAHIILNVKSERIEWRIMELLNKYKINDYFFLDSSFPMVIAMARRQEMKIALRFSEYEGLDTIRSMKQLINWVWVDCFSRTPLTSAAFSEIESLGLRVCIVSPELQGRPDDLDSHIEYFQSQKIRPHMVCSKIYNLHRWQTLFN